jgi:FkbH-like protein
MRDQVEDAIARQDGREVYYLLRAAWSADATPATANYILGKSESLRGHVSLSPCRMAVARSFTVEPVIPLCRAAALLKGIDLTVQVSGFNTYAQDLLDAQSPLYQFSPDVVLLAVQTRDIAPELWSGISDLSHDSIGGAVARVVETYKNLVTVFRANSRAHLIIHGLDVPHRPCQGYLDAQYFGQEEAVATINTELKALAHNTAGVYYLDYGALVARHGRLRWRDERKWHTVRMPIAANHLVHLADEWLRYLCPLMGKLGKVLVTDLDNTLWGGVVGEDGLEKLQLGNDYPGSAYKAVQRVLKDLSQRGIILAVCSKNNWADAMEVLEKHPEMLLRPKDFSALRINWTDKAHNLREIAQELNVGIDSLVFLDDNPAEREQIKRHLPDVTVIDLPDDPFAYADVLSEIPELERLSLSAEDRERGQLYAAQRGRKELEATVTSLEDYYWSLQQEIHIAPVGSHSLPRVAQLTQKTNQFNLTTKRYSEAQLQDLATDPAHRLFAIQVKDRFGDNGLVGAVLTRDAGDLCEIDTFLLSCRVIGRTVETAMLAFLVEECRKRSIPVLEGWYVPTAKNAPCKDLYARHGFQIAETHGEKVRWRMHLDAGTISCPAWLRMTVS